MKRFGTLQAGVLGAVLMLGSFASAAEKVVLGVFLPTSIAEGQKRFEVSEQLGVALGKALDAQVVVKNFGRFEDMQAASGKGLDLMIADGWAAVQLAGTNELLATTDTGGDQRWAVISRQKGTVATLKGKKLAVPRGMKKLVPKFVTNVMFEGDLDANHFKLLPVPNVESALQTLDSKAADAALVPLSHVPKSARVLFRSDRLPAVVAINLRGNATALREGLLSLGSIAPLKKFGAPNEREIASFRTLLFRGAPAKLPVMATTAVLRPDSAALVDMGEVGLVLPSFVGFVESPAEKPDD